MLRVQLLCVTLLVSSTLAYEKCSGKPNGVRVAHPTDCEHFYVCEDGVAAIMGTCPPGLHFNRKLRECDLKTRAGCKQLDFWAAANSCDTSSCCACCDCSGCSVCDNDLDICQGKPDSTILPYPGDCSKYVICENNCAIISECPAGQLWNPNTKACDSACNVDCSGCNNSLTVCQGKPNNSVQQYPDDCSKYVVCQNNCAVPAQCPSGQLWNPKTQCCDKACNVDCPGSGFPCTECSNNLTICNGRPDNSYQPYPDDCTKYAVCKNNCADVRECPHQQLWDVSKNSCADACTVNCTNNPYDCVGGCPEGLTVCDGKPPGSIQAYPGDCQVYVICNDDCEIVRCPSGQLWNPNSQRCDIACNVDCPGSGYPCSTSGPVGPSGVSCDSPGKCRDQPDGTLFKDDNSNGYIVCQCECDIVRPCPPTLVFNEKLSTCDWPSQENGSSVNCPPGTVYNSAIGACDWPTAQKLL